jgi:two-component system, OmpR family, response regulator
MLHFAALPPTGPVSRTGPTERPAVSKTPHIMVVDDEAPARDMVGDYLQMHGFEVTLCDGGRALREAMTHVAPDLVVLDLNMPEEDGLSIVRDLKTRARTPVIMLTATASAIDRVVGLELGADDYLAKPCELRELVARIRSVLRRAGAEAPAAEAQETAGNGNRLVRFGTKWLDLDAHALRDESGASQPLTASEYGLLKAFADHPRRVLTRERLLDLANARDADAFDRAIDVRITRIRRKIEPNPSEPRVIRTVRGAGYLFSPDGREV